MFDPLTQAAAERRLLNRVLEVPCPGAHHFFARRGVPCTPPSESRRWGWVCIERVEREIDSRRSRERAAEETFRRSQTEHRERGRAMQRARERVRVMSAIHHAAVEGSNHG